MNFASFVSYSILLNSNELYIAKTPVNTGVLWLFIYSIAGFNYPEIIFLYQIINIENFCYTG